jgi:hydroxyacylglutathione hydrolase
MDIRTVVIEETVEITRLELGAWATNCYIVVCPRTRQSVLIDVPPGARTLVKQLRGTDVQCILLTHSHIDHYAGLEALRERLIAPVGVHPADNQSWLPFVPELMLKDGSRIAVGGITLEAIHTPGHTPGSMCFLTGNYLLAGDTLFPGGPGRTISDESFSAVVKSITEKLFRLPDSTMVYPGHGQETSIGKAKAEYAVFSSREHPAKMHGDVTWLG